ncbi:MAG: DUF1097 domain-containing protein [Hyphomicrobium sp.]
MGLITALAVSIGLLGGIATYLFLSDPFMLGLQIWAAFIGWASFYHCGGKGEGFVSSVLANLWGVVWATLTLLAVSKIGLADTLSLPVWAGICVAIGVGVMILGSNIPVFSAIPATVYGYAATVALALLTAGGLADLAMPTMQNPALIVAISLVVGAVFGIISEMLAGALASS